MPLALIGPALLPGERFLPQLPVMFEPLASEYPEAAARAARDANLVASDALFPLLTDELAMRAQLAEGALPLWSPELGVGAPLAAGSMAAPWNPLRWPFLWMSPDLARGWHALLALFLAGLGLLLFLDLRVSRAAAFFGALGVQAGGFAYANLHYLPKLDAALWLPWCLWAVEVGLRGTSRRAELTLFGALAASALAGFAPIFVFVALLSGAWFCVRAFGATRRRMRRMALFAVLGLLAGAVHLVPMAQVARHSTRGPQSVEVLEAQALAPAALLGLVSPGAFGRATDELPLARHPVAWSLSRAGESAEILAGNRLEWSLYIGVTLLILALAALGTGRRAWLFPLVALLLGLAFQFAAPGVRLLYGLPGLDLGSPTRAGALSWFLWPWLAALGLDGLLRGERRVLWIALAAGSVLFVVLAGGASYISLEDSWLGGLERAIASRHGVSLEELRGYFSRDDALQAFGALRSDLWLAAGFAGATLLLCVATLRANSRWVAALLTALVGLGGFGASRGWVEPRSLAAGESLFPRSEAIEAVRLAAGGGRVLRIDTSGSPIGDVLHLARPNLLQAYGIRDLTPYVALPDADLVRALRGVDPGGSYRSGWSALTDPSKLADPLFDQLNVTCVLSRRALEPELIESQGLVPVFERDEFHVYRRPSTAGLPALTSGHSRRPFYLGALLSLFALATALVTRAEPE